MFNSNVDTTRKFIDIEFPKHELKTPEKRVHKAGFIKTLREIRQQPEANGAK